MRALRLPLIAMLCLCVVATGCQVRTTPRTIARYEPGDLPDVRKARYWGEYRLYALGEARDPAPDANPLGVVRLAQDEWVGFKRDANGYVVGVAAEQTFPLERQQRYAWQMIADAEQPTTGKTVISGAVLAVFIGVVALGAATLYAL
jgi:hypothetical protein